MYALIKTTCPRGLKCRVNFFSTRRQTGYTQCTPVPTLTWMCVNILSSSRIASRRSTPQSHEQDEPRVHWHWPTVCVCRVCRVYVIPRRERFLDHELRALPHWLWPLWCSPADPVCGSQRACMICVLRCTLCRIEIWDREPTVWTTNHMYNASQPASATCNQLSGCLAVQYRSVDLIEWTQSERDTGVSGNDGRYAKPNGTRADIITLCLHSLCVCATSEIGLISCARC